MGYPWKQLESPRKSALERQITLGLPSRFLMKMEHIEVGEWGQEIVMCWPEMTKGTFVSSYRHFVSADVISKSASCTLLFLKVF